MFAPIVGILFGLLVAIFWLWSAVIYIPDMQNTTIADEDRTMTDTLNAIVRRKRSGSAVDFIKRQGVLNAIAAIFTAFSVGWQLISTVC